MKRNRKIPKKMSVIATNTMRFGAILVLFFVMVVAYYFSTSSCNRLLKAKGELEREIAKLEDSRVRESLRWEEMKTPERIEVALLRCGLSMKPPRPDQIIKMRADGTPRPGQLSLSKLKMRTGVATASVERPSASSSSRTLKYRRSGNRR